MSLYLVSIKRNFRNVFLKQSLSYGRITWPEISLMKLRTSYVGQMQMSGNRR